MHFFAFALLVFVCGAFYEASCVGFVHFTERTSPRATAVMSVLAGAAEVTGIFESVRDWRIGVFMVAGLGTGAYLGVWYKQLRERSTSLNPGT